MLYKTIVEKVIEIISKQTGYRKCILKREHRLEADLEMDSLDRVDLIVELENYFDIEIDDNEISKETRIEDVIDIVKKNLLKNGECILYKGEIK